MCLLKLDWKMGSTIKSIVLNRKVFSFRLLQAKTAQFVFRDNKKLLFFLLNYHFPSRAYSNPNLINRAQFG